MSSFGGLFGISNDSYDLMNKSSQAMIALSALALVGGAVQGYYYKRATPYGLVCLAAFCYLLQAAINCSLSSQAGTSTDMVSRLSAASFFGPLFPIFAWVLVLDTFRSAYPKMEETTTWDILKSDLVGTFAGYLWAFIMAICDIAFVGSKGSGNLSQSMLSNASHIGEFVTYGLWGFVPLYIYQQYNSWNVTRPFFRSFAIFVTLVFLVTIGRTVNIAISMNNLDGSQAMAAEATDFVLARILGVIGLYCVIAFGRTWVNNGDSITQDDVNRFHFKYLSTLVQVCLLSLLCLCCPGMNSALSSLGAGGMIGFDITLTDTVNSLMYVFFALVGIFAGTVTNKLGVRWTLMVGGVGYFVKSTSQWVYDTKQVSGYIIAASVLFGCGAGLLWSAQGAIMMSYPEEKNKGKYIALFWSIYNISGIIGAIIPIRYELDNTPIVRVQNGTYAAFIVVMIIGLALTPVILANPSRITRPDNTKVDVHKAGDWKAELMGVLHVWKEWRMLSLIPAFFASNFISMYLNHMMLAYFNTLTRSLTGVMYWVFQILGSLAIGFLLDYQKLTRRIRALIAGAILFIIMMAIRGGGMAFQMTFEQGSILPIHYWSDAGFGGPFVLCMLYGFSDGMYQSLMYWLMGAMSNDPKILSRYAGFYKGIQLSGLAVAYGVYRSGVLLRWECLISWIILIVSFPGIFLVANRVTESNVTEEDFVPNEEAMPESYDGPSPPEKNNHDENLS